VFLYDFLMLGFLGRRVRLEVIENCDGSSIEVVFIYTVAAQHFLTLPHTFYTVQRCPALPSAAHRFLTLPNTAQRFLAWHSTAITCGYHLNV